MPIPRIVLDTAAFITAMRSKNGAAQEVLAMIAARRIILVMDLKIALEYRAVALRNEHLLTAGMSHKEMLIAITDLESFAETV